MFQADHSRYHNSHAHHLRHQPKEHNSVPNSPNETDLGRGGRSSGPNSAHTSPVGGARKDHTPTVQVRLIINSKDNKLWSADIPDNISLKLKLWWCNWSLGNFVLKNHPCIRTWNILHLCEGLELA